MAAPVLFIPVSGTYTAELVARTALTGAIWWRIEVDDGAGYDDYTAYLSNNEVRIQGADGGRWKEPTAASVQFTLRNVPKILSEGDWRGYPVKVSAKVGASEYIQMFFGYVDPGGVTRTRGRLAEDLIQVNARDPAASRGVARKAQVQTLFTGLKICDTGTPANSIAHLLAAGLGHATGDCDFVTINKTKDYAFVDRDASYWRELQDLALQHGAYLGHRYDGKLRLITWTEAEWNTPTPEYTFDNTNVHGPLGSPGSTVVCNRVVTDFETYQVLTAGRIWKSLQDYNETTKKNAIVIASGKYWPEADDENAFARCQYERAGERFPIGVSIVTPTLGRPGSGSAIEYIGSGTLSIESFNGTAGTNPGKTQQHADSAELILKATGGSVTITKLVIRGTPIRVLSKVKVLSSTASLDEWEYIERTLPGKYATSASQSKVSCYRLVKYGEVARKRYENVPCDFTPHVQTGAIVTFNPTSDVNMTAVVESYRHESKGPHSLTRTYLTLIEHVSYTESETGDTQTDNVGSDPTPGPGAIGAEELAMSYDNGTGVFENYDLIPDGAELFDLRSPDAISSEGRVPTARYKKYIPGKVNDETGTPILSPWSKFSGLGAMAFTRATANVLLDPEDLTTANWVAVSTGVATLSAKKFGASYWSLVTNGAASAGFMRQAIAASTFSVNSTHKLSFMCKKNTAAVSRFVYRDNTAGADRAYLTITWATQTITVTTGTFLAAFWWVANDTVEIMVRAAACTNGNVHHFRCFASDAATITESTYWTRVIAADLDDVAAVYTPTRRVQSRVIYPYPANASLLAGKISCWALPLFVYNCGSNQYAWSIGANAEDNAIHLRYDFTTDKWIAQLRVDSSNYRQALSTAAWTDNTNLGVWRYFEVEWDVAAQTITLKENGTLQTGSATAGTVTGLVFPNEDLRIGARGATDLTQLDGLVHDLLVEPA